MLRICAHISNQCVKWHCIYSGLFSMVIKWNLRSKSNANVLYWIMTNVTKLFVESYRFQFHFHNEHYLAILNVWFLYIDCLRSECSIHSFITIYLIVYKVFVKDVKHIQLTYSFIVLWIRFCSLMKFGLDESLSINFIFACETGQNDII